jgi:hypothetical protein
MLHNPDVLLLDVFRSATDLGPDDSLCSLLGYTTGQVWIRKVLIWCSK